MSGQNPSEACPGMTNCSFLTSSVSVDAAADVIKKMYCLKDYQKCSRYQLILAGKPVPDNLWPNGQECKQC